MASRKEVLPAQLLRLGSPTYRATTPMAPTGSPSSLCSPAKGMKSTMRTPPMCKASLLVLLYIMPRLEPDLRDGGIVVLAPGLGIHARRHRLARGPERGEHGREHVRHLLGVEARAITPQRPPTHHRGSVGHVARALIHHE